MVPEEEPKKYEYSEDQPDPNKYEVLKMFDFPEDLKGENIVHYDNAKLTLYDIFQDYGTEAKPKDDPKYDPEPPKPKEKVEKPPAPVPPPVPKDDENKDEEEK